MTTSRIAQLASLILSNTTYIDAYLSEHGIPSLSFDISSPTTIFADDSLAGWRQIILEATDELHALMLGPIGILTSPSHNFLTSLQAICRFNLATSFPIGHNQTTITDLALKSGSGLSDDQVGRIIRHAASYRIFSEPSKGVVVHTAASKVLEQNKLMRDWISMVADEMWPAATRTVDAISKWPGSQEPFHSGFNLVNDTSLTVFEELSRFPTRESRYAAAMSWFSTNSGLDPIHLLQGFEWGRLPANSVVVDIGGSYGAMDIEIARNFPSLQCIVQDRPEIAAAGRSKLPAELQKRVTFMAHDFFREQPVRNADVYLLRWILHDWSDKYATRILQALIPALKVNAKVLVAEHILPEPGAMSVYQERSLRNFDLSMLEFHNAKERDLQGWQDLFGEADYRFKFLGVKTPVGSRLGFLEFEWDVGNGGNSI